MVNVVNFKENLKKYLHLVTGRVTSKNMFFYVTQSIINTAADNFVDKNTKILDLLADINGNIDVDYMVTDMWNKALEIQPKSFDLPFGNISIGEGKLKINLPVIPQIVLGQVDIDEMKRVLTE